MAYNRTITRYIYRKTTMANTANQEYNSSDIRVLNGLEAVRKRPAMYIGGTGRDGLHHIFTEILDNSVDEAIAGFCDQIWVTLYDDGSVEVRDNGRGIPIDMHPQTGLSTLETVMTNLHAGGKFEKGAYKVSGGLHGVGMKCTNALSEWMTSTVYKDGKTYQQKYARGITQTKLEVLGDTKQRGTMHRFKPDIEIFPDIAFSFKRILEKCRQHAYLTGGLRFTILDQREETNPKEYELYFENGIKSYIKFSNLEEKVLHDIFYTKKEEDDVIVEVAIQYTESLEENVKCYSNNIPNPEGGTHLAGLRTALTSAINQYAASQDLLKGIKGTLDGDDVREGLTAVISVKVPDPQFEGQTKMKLNNPEVKGIVQKVVKEELTRYFAESPKEAKNIISKAVLALKARAAAKAARDAVIRKGVLDSTALPGKLADCQSKDASLSELYIVEGNSAGGCFSGDTKVSLADGRELSFVELIEEQEKGIQNYCYTVDKNNNIQIEKIKNVRKTKSNAEVIKVHLDNEESIICTPDHKFMLRDGSYKQAKDLTISDSLMPLYRQLSEISNRITIEGYEMVLNPNDSKWIFTHMLADENKYSNQEKANNEHRHHIDFNKRNNNPENIIRLDKEEHKKLHQVHIAKTLHTPETKAKLKIIKQSIEFRQFMSSRMKQEQTSKVLSSNAKKQWANPEYKEFMKQAFLKYYKENQEKENARLFSMQNEYWNSENNRKIQSKRLTEFFRLNPNAKSRLSALANKQWSSEELKQWRANKTKEQWTTEFREKRLKAYNQTYLRKSLELAKAIIESNDIFDIQKYENSRLEKRDMSVLKFTTLVKRFFEGNIELTIHAAQHYNHKITKIEKLNEKIDVYDLEVPKTHNFALSSGIFVHNSAKQGRDRKYQAVLPLRGKIINSHKYRIDRVLANQEFKDIVTALGVGIGETLNTANLRYHKVVIMADADVDGSHIRALILTLLFRFFKPLIEQGYVYVAQPPLFKVEVGKERYYVLSELEKNKLVKSAESKGKKVSTNRFKGLGEMDAQQLWETTMDPAQRVLKRVNMTDAEDAEKVFEMLMGVEVPPRRRFIQKYAKFATIDA